MPPHLQATPAELELIDDTAEQPKIEPAALAAPAVTGPVERTWFDAPQAQIDALDIPDFGNEDDDDLDVSIDFEHPARRRIGLLALGGLVVAGGIAVAAYIAFSGGLIKTSAPAARAIAPAAADVVPAATPVAPAAAPAIIDTETAAAAPVVPTGVVLHRATFTSEPEGATVTLVMNGRPVVLGAAPVDAQLDPTKSYEVVFTMQGRETVLRSVAFDDSGAIAMNAALSEADADTALAEAAEPAAAEPAAAEAAAIDAEPEAIEPEAVEPAPIARKATRKKTRSVRRENRNSATRSKPAVATSIPKGSGVLMLNAKPPCDIVIDGKPTGKQTPQRALTLAAGKHRIELVNKTYGIKAGFTVSIKAGEKTRVIKDLTDRM
ncbi:MAG TPA: PEGA domain-containing protein [Kofleriaceae bacterium]|nr:PEGA domain-containing protein [Kofleriaceae bacterium]